MSFKKNIYIKISKNIGCNFFQCSRKKFQHLMVFVVIAYINGPDYYSWHWIGLTIISTFDGTVLALTSDFFFLQVEPIRNFFAALFLASIGMLIHVHFLWNHVDILLASVILVIIVKTVVIAAVVKGFGYNNKTSVLVCLYFQLFTWLYLVSFFVYLLLMKRVLVLVSCRLACL